MSFMMFILLLFGAHYNGEELDSGGMGIRSILEALH
jgi:hypothetical protein